MEEKDEKTRIFIERAKAIHGDRYDYSETVYGKNNKEKVKIHCNVCGSDFMMSASNHVNMKQGCPTCFGTRNLSNEEWIEKAKQVHGDRYDYSLTHYVNIKTPVRIICREHGVFSQMPQKHLMGRMCPECRNYKPSTFEEFLYRARKIHGDKFCYNEHDFHGIFNPMVMFCKKHGFFIQTPSMHFVSKGCPECAKESKAEKQSMSTDEFLERAKAIHGDKYDYSQTVCVNSYTPVEITCKIHGKFFQKPYDHLRSTGCPECGRDIVRQLQVQNRVGTEEFIRRAKAVHGDKYDYSKVEYVKNDKPVEIICPKHGSFWQKPHKHWIGHGCPKCIQSKLESDVMELLIKNGIPYIPQASNRTLKFMGMLKLDFYLPRLNIGIECQGHQHFKIVEFFSGANVFERDRLKYEKCTSNGVKLIYYTDLVELAQSCEFYNDKTIFYNITELNNFITNESTNQEKGLSS